MRFTGGPPERGVRRRRPTRAAVKWTRAVRRLRVGFRRRATGPTPRGWTSCPASPPPSGPRGGPSPWCPPGDEDARALGVPSDGPRVATPSSMPARSAPVTRATTCASAATDPRSTKGDRDPQSPTTTSKKRAIGSTRRRPLGRRGLSLTGCAGRRCGARAGPPGDGQTFGASHDVRATRRRVRRGVGSCRAIPRTPRRTGPGAPRRREERTRPGRRRASTVATAAGGGRAAGAPRSEAKAMRRLVGTPWHIARWGRRRARVRRRADTAERTPGRARAPTSSMSRIVRTSPECLEQPEGPEQQGEQDDHRDRLEDVAGRAQPSRVCAAGRTPASTARGRDAARSASTRTGW